MEEWTFSMLSLEAVSGFPMRTMLSNLPGLRRAGSIMSGRLVAPITNTSPTFSMPSIDVSS